MLYKDKITANFCIINYILKEIKYTEGFRRKISDSEIITIAFIAVTMRVIIRLSNLLFGSLFL